MNKDTQLSLMRDISTKEGFTHKFYEYLAGGLGCQQAFDRLNKEYKDLFGHKRYSSYDSYRKVRDRQMKKHK